MSVLRRRNNSGSLTPTDTTDANVGGRNRHGQQRSNSPFMLAGAFSVLVVMCILGMWASSAPSDSDDKILGRNIVRDERHQQKRRTKFHKKPPLHYSPDNNNNNEELEEDRDELELRHGTNEDYDYDYDYDYGNGERGLGEEKEQDYDYRP